MKIDENDATLTAYALGELSSEEAAAFEARLANDASLQKAVDEIRNTAQMLSAQFAAEPALRLTDAQRQRVQQRPEPVSSTRMIFRARALWLAGGLAAAACLSMAIVVPILVERHRSQNEVAKNSETKQSSEADRQKKGELSALIEKAQAPDSDLQALTKTRDGKDVGADETRKLAETASQAAAGQDAEIPPGSLKTPVTTPPPPPPRAPAAAPGRSEQATGGLREPAIEVAPPGSAASPSAAGRGNAPGSGGTGAGFGGGGGGEQLRRAPGADPAPASGREVDRTSNTRRQLEPPADKEAGAKPDAGVEKFNREGLALIVDNPFVRSLDNPLSTFSIDVDTASYSNVRRHLMQQKQLPAPSAVRIEEMINYFKYNSYEAPTGVTPFSANVEVNAAPWNPEHRLMRIGLRGKDVKADMRRATSLVFLIDVSGSMQGPDRLPLVKDALRLLVDKLNGDDRLAIVTYAGTAGKVLDSTYVSAENKTKITQAIDSLSAGGSTNGAGGIEIAYGVAADGFIGGGVNRVILCTDGDFNVGVSSDGELVRLIEQKRDSGVMLSVLGFGTGNFQDGKMEQLADHGNGNFAYIDGIDEAKKVLVDQMTGTLETIAKDVKIQVDFNPGKVGAYRLIGYEDRMLTAQDFRDDRKDAGEIGAGHTVTALYEIIPASEVVDAPAAPKSKFVEAGKLIPSDLLAELRIRYKQPDGSDGTELAFPVSDAHAGLDKASSDFQFAAGVAAFGMVLRDSEHKGSATFQTAIDLAVQGLGDDKDGRRKEFLDLIDAARLLTAPQE